MCRSGLPRVGIAKVRAVKLIDQLVYIVLESESNTVKLIRVRAWEFSLTVRTFLTIRNGERTQSGSHRRQLFSIN